MTIASRSARSTTKANILSTVPNNDIEIAIIPPVHDLGDGYSLATWGSSGVWTLMDASNNGIIGRPDGTVDNLNGSGGGSYSDSNVSDEFYWAAAELYLTTHESQYLVKYNRGWSSKRAMVVRNCTILPKAMVSRQMVLLRPKSRVAMRRSRFDPPRLHQQNQLLTAGRTLPFAFFEVRVTLTWLRDPSFSTASSFRSFTLCEISWSS